MSKKLPLIAIALVLWIGWCILAVTELVPMLQRHVTMWGWFLSWVLCMLPVLIVAFRIVARVRSTS